MRHIHTSTNNDKTAKVVYDNEYDEYQVHLYEHGQRNADATYFTDDKEDAIGTSEHMVGLV